MPGTGYLLGFIAAALVVLVIPGPGVLYIIARSVAQGQRSGLVSVLGLSFGALAHVVAATAGLSAILLASATAFELVKLLGAAYLVFLGVQTLMSRRADTGVDTPVQRSPDRVFLDGVIISILNPKIAIFFIAFLPQFVDPGGGPASRQILFLGLLYIVLALLTDSAYAILSSRLRHWVGNRVIQGPLPRYASGCIFIGLGIGAALADRR